MDRCALSSARSQTCQGWRILFFLSHIAESSIVARVDLELVAEVVDDPEKQAEENAKQKAGDQRKRDGPASSVPVEVTWKTAKRDIEAVEAKHDYAGYY